MATVTGQTGVVKLQLAGASEAVVGEVKSFNIDTGNNILEVTKMGDTGRKYTSGLDETSVSIDCFWDQADAQQLVLDAGASIDFEISPSGTAANSKYYSGNGIVASKSISVSFDGMVEATFAITGGTVSEEVHS